MEHNTHHEKKSFFEKYQTPLSIIIAGLFVAGAIVLTKIMPDTQPANQLKEQGQTESQVRNELIETAKKIGVDKKSLAACLDSKAKEGAVKDAVALAQQSGVQGTPTFFIIKRTFDATGAVAAEKQIPIIGARDQATFIATIVEGKAPEGQPEMPASQKIVLTDADHILGPKNAAVTIVEYSDIDCPFCKRAKPTIDQILKDHPEYALVYRHSPIAQLHPLAEYKAQAAECVASVAGEPSFWKFMDIIAK